MAILGRFKKQPVEVLDYLFDFNPWLTDRGDTLSAFVVTADPGLTIANATQSAGVVRYFASGGLSNERYTVTCTITTNSTPPRTKQAEMVIVVKDEK